tara:strand:+ start:81 stop:1253 length:1173 start_codon:yes stop_codon:yes gene_type:complete
MGNQLYLPNTGAINMPKMLRHLSHRTNQVRDLLFIRDAIKRKDTKTTGQTSATKGSSTTLAGPAVNFGYETDSYADQNAGVDAAYHVDSPEIVLPGLKAMQTPIISRSGQHERSGHRVVGECKFYLPTMNQIKLNENIDSIQDASLTVSHTGLQTPVENPWYYLQEVAELETNDKLIDVEKIVDKATDYYNDDDDGNPSTTTKTLHSISIGDTFKLGYESDRIKFQIRGATSTLTDSGQTIRVSANETISYIEIYATMSGSDATLRWTPDSSFSFGSGSHRYKAFDLPISNVKAGDKTQLQSRSTNAVFTASITGGFDSKKLIHDSSPDSQIEQLRIATSSGSVLYVKEIYLYRAGEWRIQSIKDYRDSYQEIRAVKVRGERISRRRAYG